MAVTTLDASSGRGSVSLSRESLQLLERRLAQFRSSEATLAVARRLFQKCPEVAEEMEKKMEVAADMNKTQRLWTARRMLLRKVYGAIGSEDSAMPNKLENYLSFLDLAGVVASCGEQVQSSGVSPHTWRVFLLREFNWSPPLSTTPLRRLRRRMKRFLPDSLLSSVQLDLEEEEGNSARVFFRVAVVNRTKSGRNDEGNLLKKAPTFLAFYPGEPYFYSDRAEPDPIIAEALCSCLNSSGYAPLPLSGPHLESLRTMRLERDASKRGEEEEGEERPGTTVTARQNTKKTQFGERDLFDDLDMRWEGERADDHESPSPLFKKPRKEPLLDRLTLERPVTFRDGHVLKDYHGGRLPNLVDNLDVKLTFRSRDVLSSLRSMTECGVLTAAASSSSAAAAATGSLQPPNWLDEVSVRGRNVIRLKERGTAAMTATATSTQNGIRGQEEEDDASVADSEVTIVR